MAKIGSSLNLSLHLCEMLQKVNIFCDICQEVVNDSSACTLLCCRKEQWHSLGFCCLKNDFVSSPAATFYSAELSIFCASFSVMLVRGETL